MKPALALMVDGVVTPILARVLAGRVIEALAHADELGYVYAKESKTQDDGGRQLHAYAQVDYAQIARDLDELEARSRNALLPLLKDARDALLAAVRRAKNPRRLAKVSRDLRLAGMPRIRRTLRAMLRRAWAQGGEDARAEVGAPRAYAGWDESKHPRNPKGDDRGGEFSSSMQAKVDKFWKHNAHRDSSPRSAYEADRVFDSIKKDLVKKGFDDNKKVSGLTAADQEAWRILNTIDKPSAYTHAAYAGWDESKHPRNPKGSGDPSGEFAPAGGALPVNEHRFSPALEQELQTRIDEYGPPSEGNDFTQLSRSEALKDWLGLVEEQTAADRKHIRTIYDEANRYLISRGVYRVLSKEEESGMQVSRGAKHDLKLGGKKYVFVSWDLMSGSKAESHSYASPSFTPRGAVQWMNSKELFITGLLGDGIVGKAKGVIVNAIKTGEAGSVTAEKLWKTFEPFIGDPNVLEDGEPLAPYQLDTIIRTNTTEAYNHGRLNEFVRDDLLPFLDGVRYSAVMDSRTTPVCAFLDGKVFDPESPDLVALLPPNHFNCRSIIVPIVAGEKIDEADFITDAEVGQAMALADAKFLEQEV